MANVFISHRKIDAAAAERLSNDIVRAGHRVWLDEWAIGIGDSIVERVDKGLEGLSYLVLCYSASGLSHWVDREWQSVLARQLGGHGVKLLPVLPSGGSPPAILADIKYADLITDWGQGVGQLLKAIR